MQSTVKEISRTSTTFSYQPIRLPDQALEIVASLYTIAPGTELPLHRHPFPRFGYVLKGELTIYNEDTGQVVHLREGQFGVEAIEQRHRGKSTGSGPLTLLVIDQVPPGMHNVDMLETSG
ncbi:cupin domain-containing protein [Rhizobium leguminosarum]|uniref:Cupin domain-containing protein n=1 Tax=Rhizobium leguminosarum TaxID=384 RepID=A0A444I7E9_RHILE|nr:cupin domain-containing protein [Rhizobium leguminosarum]RWX34214.1 cupin domain-containing protein [Rhizobium leguminosarum]